MPNTPEPFFRVPFGLQTQRTTFMLKGLSLCPLRSLRETDFMIKVFYLAHALRSPKIAENTAPTEDYDCAGVIQKKPRNQHPVEMSGFK
jgi:hypothetical protein